MGRFVVALTIFSLLIFCRFSYPTPTLCEQIKQKAPKLSNYNFTEEWLKKLNLKNYPLIDSAVYLKLFEEDVRLTSDSIFALGWFDISPTRLGFVCCTKTYECDHRVAYLSLRVIDNCDSVVYIDYHLTSTDDDSPFYFEDKAIISKGKKTLTTITKHTSEWVDFTDVNIQDTTFTETYKIDLSLSKIDTVYEKVSFKLIKKQ
ncbi:MAG TPA: hypothetical protein VN698_16075 [Bacteroidia bacterium]|nr:hypothetical protein [Bacteroidia bacterium]